MEQKKNGHFGCAVETDWPEFEQHLRSGMQTVDSLAESMGRLERRLEDLQYLRKLEDISGRLLVINDNLIGPATSLDRVPFRALWLQFVLFFMTMLIIASILIVERVKDTKTSVNVNTKGLSIEAEK